MEFLITFLSGKRAEILGLVTVFILSLLVEWISHTRFLSNTNNNVRAGLIQTGLYSVRAGMAYLLMLAVMSFDAGMVLLAAVAGHSVGFMIFGGAFSDKDDEVGYHEKPSSDLPPLNC